MIFQLINLSIEYYFIFATLLKWAFNLYNQDIKII